MYSWEVLLRQLSAGPHLVPRDILVSIALTNSGVQTHSNLTVHPPSSDEQAPVTASGLGDFSV